MSTIKDLILGMRKLREAANLPWNTYIEPIGPMSYDLESWQAVITPRRQTPIYNEHRERALADCRFIAAAPTNQARLESALLIAVEGIESVMGGGFWDPRGIFDDIEAALGGDS